MFWQQPHWWWWSEEEKMRHQLKKDLAKLVNLYDTDTILDELREALNLKADWTPDGAGRDKILRVILSLEDLTKKVK